jgi:uncharacterized membrane protein YkoI
MLRTTMRRGSTTLALALALAACDRQPGGDGDAVVLTLLEAIAVAESKVPDGLTIDAELIVEDDAVYDVDRWIADETHSVIVDAASGDVLASSIDPEDEEEAALQAEALMASPVTLTEAVEIALEEVPGTAVSVEIDDDLETILVVLVLDEEAIGARIDLADGTYQGSGDVPPDDD